VNSLTRLLMPDLQSESFLYPSHFKTHEPFSSLNEEDSRAM
jgi:hypothetical protein